ncbi:hypothetical protein MIMGU_mgv1a0001782mg, partial [Erythranthe guttata]
MVVAAQLKSAASDD